MKKFGLFSLFLFLTVSFFSCQKDSGGGSSSSGYYIKANIGGADKNYTSTPLVTVLNSGGTYAVALSAGASTTSSEGLGFEITSNTKSIGAGTYNQSSADYVIAGDYNPGTTDVSAIFGAGLNPFTPHPLQIIISQYDDKVVSGTFSGEFYDNSGIGSDSLLISNGSFNLPVH